MIIINLLLNIKHGILITKEYKFTYLEPLELKDHLENLSLIEGCQLFVEIDSMPSE